MIPLILFIFGTIVGSFLNVCIYRLPKEESVISPRSHCPKCKKQIPWHDNIPFISYILLGGHCRFCRGKISIRYFAVEFLTAALFLGFYLFFGMGAKYVIYAAIGCALIVVTFIDFEHKIIPDEITLPGVAAGLLASVLLPDLHQTPARLLSLASSFLGAAAGAGTLYSIGVLGKWIFKKEAMGGGDVKLMAMLGAFLGWQAVLLTIFLSSLAGSFVGLYLKFKYKTEHIPYGPFLALGAIVSMMYGNEMRLLGLLGPLGH